MPDPDLQSRLFDLDYPVLVDVARELEIEVPAGTSKQDLVSLLVSNAPRRLESLARPAQLLEVEHQDRALRATLEGELAEQAADWEKKLSAKVERLGEKIETLQEAVGDVKNVFKFVTSGISILAAVATVLGAYNILDLWTTKEDFEQLQDQIQADAVELRSFTGGSRNILINKLLDETEDALRSFSSSLFELELQNRLRANHEVTTEVLSVYSDGHRPLNGASLNGGSPDESLTILEILRDIHEGLLSVEDVARMAEDNRAASLNNACKIFQTINTDDTLFTKPRYREFVRDLEAYRLNVLGVLEMRRYQYVSRSLRYLDDADSYFESSIGAKKEFARPHSNRMVVVARKYGLSYKEHSSDKEIDEKEKQELLSLLFAGHSFLKEAFGYTEDVRERSLIINNGAYLHLKKAELFGQLSDREGSVDALDEADAEIRRARRLRDPHPVVFTTEAEIQAARIPYESALNNELIFEKIIDSVTLACERGYVYSSTFIEDNPAYKNIESLGIKNWRKRLEDAARECK